MKVQLILCSTKGCTGKITPTLAKDTKGKCFQCHLRIMYGTLLREEDIQELRVFEGQMKVRV